MSVKEIINNLKKAKKNYQKAIKTGVLATAHEVRNIAVKSIQQVSHGQVVKAYKQGGNPYNRVVSAAGDAPNADTGRLAQSIAVEMRPSDYKTAHVGTDVKYSSMLEFGTRSMKARPFLNPALNQVKKDKLLEKNIKKAAAKVA